MTLKVSRGGKIDKAFAPGARGLVAIAGTHGAGSWGAEGLCGF